MRSVHKVGSGYALCTNCVPRVRCWPGASSKCGSGMPSNGTLQVCPKLRHPEKGKAHVINGMHGNALAWKRPRSCPLCPVWGVHGEQSTQNVSRCHRPAVFVHRCKVLKHLFMCAELAEALLVLEERPALNLLKARELLLWLIYTVGVCRRCACGRHLGLGSSMCSCAGTCEHHGTKS
jgi:hypothetical protein